MKEIEKDNSINDLINGTLNKIQTLMETKTVVGDAVVSPNGSIIIPISKVSCGFVIGGGEYSDNTTRRISTNYPMAGGSGGGVTITPVGFLVESNGETSFINVENKTEYQTVLNIFNKLINKIGEEK